LSSDHQITGSPDHPVFFGSRFPVQLRDARASAAQTQLIRLFLSSPSTAYAAKGGGRIMSTSSNLGSSIRGEVRSRAGWHLFLGIVTAALGLLLMAYPLATATATTILIGCVLIIAGVIDIVLALRAHTVGRFFLRLLLGIVYGLGGLLLLIYPLRGVAVLTLVLGVMLLVEAGLDAVMAFETRPVSGWGWFLFDCIITLILGILILAHWPNSAIWAIGTLVGAAVLVRGITRIALSAGLRRAMGRVEDEDIRRPRAA
jgi:uncharacterized membrane protein HdeD (DUF308 family)